ncbi:MAG: ISNCY family transposase, partial [Candidatus Omnitrophica bacterium]|nr:ISNCY family transposase [Candidatus Omnitrophota bacterium]
RVIRLYRQKYPDFGPKLANEKLLEIDRIKIGDQTLRNWLMEDGAWQIIHKKRKHRQWRERMHHFGQMVQLDGSHHDWLEGRGPKCVLMGYIDDATNIIYVRFYGHEGTFPAMDGFKRYITRYGIPHSVYLDKHSTYRSTAKRTIEDELNNTDHLSQFERALKELGVEVIHANSPEAKGRIERLFETLQDRLVKEMRLRKVKTIKEANILLGWYLPGFNKRFSLPALKKGDLHRRLPSNIELDKILCKRYEHALRNDSTVVHKQRLYQILDRINAKRATVEERISGRMLITYKGKALKYKVIAQRPEKEEKPKYIFTMVRKECHKPPMDHPLKGPMFKARYRHNSQYSQKEKGAQKEKGLLLKPDTSKCVKTGHF